MDSRGGFAAPVFPAATANSVFRPAGVTTSLGTARRGVPLSKSGSERKSRVRCTTCAAITRVDANIAGQSLVNAASSYLQFFDPI